MAEHVQAALDAMVAPLLDLQERQVFTPDEVRAVLGRRREAEYRLRRRQARKADFVAYLQDEMRLEQLRILRAKRQKREEYRKRMSKEEDQGDDDRQSKHVGDRHVLQHILLLWTRTLRKYRDDLGLWLSYIEFLKSTHRLYRRLSAVYGEALRFHPRATGLWIEAASWECFERSNLDGARILLQRALRLNPKSRELWLQAFVLELHVAQKLEGRRRILRGSDDDDAATLPNNGESDNEAKDESNTKGARGDPYALARIVLEHAAQQLKVERDVHALYLECLRSCQSFPLESTRALQRDLLNKLKSSAAAPGGGHGTVLSWMAEAAWVRNAGNRSFSSEEPLEPASKRPRTDDGHEPQQYRDPVLQVLRNATQAVRNEEMYLEAIQFLSEYLRQLEEDHNDDDDDDDDAVSEARSLLDALWTEARGSDFFTPRMVLGYADYLAENSNDDEACSAAAVQALQDYIDSGAANETTTAVAAGFVPASVWLRLAELQAGQRQTGSSDRDLDDAIATLRRGIDRTPSCQRDHLTLLVQLMGALLEANPVLPSEECSRELWSLLDRILLAYPGGASDPNNDGAVDPGFGVRNVPEACVAFQRRVADHEGVDGSRRLYEKLLFHSGFSKCCLRQEEDGQQYVERVVDQAMAAESKCAMWKERRTNLLRLIDCALRNISSKQSLEKYRKARDEIKYGTCPQSDQHLFSACTSVPAKIPSFDMSSIDVSPQLLQRAYDVFQVVHLRNVPLRTQSSAALTWRDLDPLYQNLGSEDQKSWCVETSGQGDVSPGQFLKDEYSKALAYCSFLVQNDKEALGSLLAKLPSPPNDLLGWDESLHEPAVWVFFGRNAKGSAELDGRPEHTDSVSHDGTWHVQLSGRKRWVLRPSCDMLQHLRQYLPRRCTKGWTEEVGLEVECSERDVFIINTRLWFHQTFIPVQHKPSVSLARDFRFLANAEADPNVPEMGAMSNVDGLYARSNIEKGTIIFTEDDMPNAELHVSSSDPNCRVVVMEDGSSAVVAMRPIVAGEFFCVPPSDDEKDVVGSEGSANDE